MSRAAAVLACIALLAVGVPALARASGTWLGSPAATEPDQPSCDMDAGPYADVQIDTHPRVALEVARTPEERQTGLMYRESLAPDSGMLFIFDTPTTGGFWMRNTLVPLSIAFIDQDGSIVDIQNMEPLDEQTIHYPAAPYTYALEVAQGWFLAHGVGVGQVVELCVGR